MTTSETHEKPEEEFILLKDSKKTHKVLLSDIKYIESDGDYIRFYLNSRKLMVRGSLSSLEVTLHLHYFLGYIIHT